MYEWMEPKKKRRQLFRSEEYRDAQTIEEADWMRRQETGLLFLPGVCDWVRRQIAGLGKPTTPTSGST